MVFAAMLGCTKPNACEAAFGDGVPLWTNRYHGPGLGDNVPTALAVDPQGDVVVSGYSPGNGSGNDFATIKYSSSGTPLWTRRYNGPGNYDTYATAVAIDAVGNVFVTGSSLRSEDGALKYHYATLAYSSAGTPLWTNLYADSGNSLAMAAAVDLSGNVFVTGSASNSVGTFNYATVAYSNNGVPLWTNQYDGPSSRLDSAQVIAVDNAGNVFVTGLSVGLLPPGVEECATVAYSGAGVPLWTNRFKGADDFTDSRGTGIAVDNHGKVFVTGYTGFIGTNFYYDYATLAYSTDGQPLWTNMFDGPAGTDDRAQAVAVDSSGNVLVTGASTATNGYHDYATLSYSGAGQLLWESRFNGPGGRDGRPKAIAVDPHGNVFVTGQAVNSALNYGFYTLAYSRAGLPLWTNSYYGAKSPYYSYPSAIAADRDGNVFVTGYSRSEVNGLYYDYATLKYSSRQRPYLAIRPINNQIVLSWTNAGYLLQSGPALDGPFTNVSSASSPCTNSLMGSQQYFRLEAN
jgi:hypothetical protein